MNARILLTCLLASIASIATAQDAALPPGVMLLPESALPDYEAKIDHARLIREVNRQVLQQGREVYQRICHNCHGDLNLPGSIPNSLRFGEGEFQHGNDPYKMYQTITRGWRLMAPQMQLMPREKYAVIHYIRDHFLKQHNPAQHFNVTRKYLAGLPKGKDLGPAPVKHEPWRDMDYGPFLIGTFEIANEQDRAKPWPKGKQPDHVAPDANIVHKAIAIRLDQGTNGVTGGNTWIAFEHDTMRVAGAWQGEGFIDWNGINFNGRHVVRPRTVGAPLFETANAPGWANPATGRFADLRFTGVDGRRFGPLPRSWTHFKGLYKDHHRIVIKYTVGKTEVLESHRLLESNAIVRILNIGKSATDLKLRLGNAGTKVRAYDRRTTLNTTGGFVVATIPAKATPCNIAFIYGDTGRKEPALNLSLKRRRPQSAWPESIATPIIRGTQPGPFQWDSFPMPVANPWKSRLRASGVDFTPDGKSAIVCCWDGDVWRVDGIADEDALTCSWRRIASGLFQPLGVKLVNGDIFVSCRDQIVRLHDEDDDGETDYYENFNSDHQVTEHFHEFAMGLQADSDGNLYYAKSARHARPQLVAHHGTLLKVAADGSRTDILANGFRAANGVCRNPDGTFFVTDQEGHWNPMNRINWVKPSGRFYGNMWSYGAPDDESDSAMEPPLCWVDKRFDRSPSELLWIESKNWGPLNGSLLNLSYGHGRLEIIPHEKVAGQLQGGLCRLPIPDFATGTMRGRFHPRNGHLYLCGMSAWGTAQMHLPGGFYRIRKTTEPAHLPIDLRAHHRGVNITFSDPLAPDSIKNVAEQFDIHSWALKRSANYGSKHYDERRHQVTAAKLSQDGKTLRLAIEDMKPVWQMSIEYRLQGANGSPVTGEIQNTIHKLGSHR